MPSRTHEHRREWHPESVPRSERATSDLVVDAHRCETRGGGAAARRREHQQGDMALLCVALPRLPRPGILASPGTIFCRVSPLWRGSAAARFGAPPLASVGGARFPTCACAARRPSPPLARAGLEIAFGPHPTAIRIFQKGGMTVLFSSPPGGLRGAPLPLCATIVDSCCVSPAPPRPDGTGRGGTVLCAGVLLQHSARRDKHALPQRRGEHLPVAG